MIHYSIIPPKKYEKGYGIKIIKEKTVNDISTNFSAILKLVNMCNKAEVDFDHFEDVLENFIDDLNTF